ncbi:MAG: energy-coupling factor ABC transporter permease [Paludibacterium sp.]|uniref:energy-coupling factor ABC transporter permease n=1 Tax=Paludibacterium sp. TaxID=1917523 RepID=UPI0025F25E43|nr:energy-coupling factor ABC transporter permease [Paludibacterium sp.]MBV8045767.1 energy-coupling factor ABC transporter permease [Paludibacterium sp.]MBV8649247.1 energy-coupling factor ABC transporter permease [Paludibacterium sp.]
MHIEDGILSPQACATWYAAATVFVVPGIYEIKRRIRDNLAYKPFLAMVGVAVFVISAMHLPVPVTGSCSHPCGTTLAAIIVGPFASVVISAIVLFFQAVFLGHGGITTIGANTFSMGIAGALTGYLLWKGLRALHCPLWLAAGVAGLVGDLMTYFVSAFELAWSLHGNVPLWRQCLIFFMGYAPTQVPLAIAEAVFTVAVLQAMLSRRPDLLRGVLAKKGA